LKASNRSRGLGAKIARHKRYANHYRVLQGLICKAAKSFFLFFLLCPWANREGAAAGLAQIVGATAA
jgi:hypothetical protein